MGIIDGNPLGLDQQANAEQEADTIFTCVFLGLLTEGLRNNWSMGWDVEPEADINETRRALEILKSILEPLAEYVAGTLRQEGVLQQDASIRVGTSPAHWYAVEKNKVTPRDGEAVFVGIRADRDISTDVTKRQQRTISEKLKGYILEDLIGDLTVDKSEDLDSDYQKLLRSKTDNEFGAYYGIVDHKDNFPPKVLSSVRRLIPYKDEYGRWKRGVDYHGLIGYDQTRPPQDWQQSPKQAGSFEPTELLVKWAKQGGKDCVCGYCHGMNWAVAQAACQYPADDDGNNGGIPFELGLGERTLKLASCFGCTTFMYANGLVPSSAHLGRSESWVPLPEDTDSAGVFYNETDNTRDINAIVKTFKDLNQRWADKVSEWMVSGADLIAKGDMFQDWARDYTGRLPDYVERLKRCVSAPHRDESEISVEKRLNRMVANLFLDALTVHKKDVERLQKIVKQ